MRPEQREALDNLLVRMHAGRMKRRTFLENALAIGLTSSAAQSLLAACGGSQNSSGGNGAAINIVWQGENDLTGIYQQLVNTFNQTNKDGIHVTFINGPTDTGQLHSIFLDMLRSQSNAVDIISMDIIWPAEFAINQWTVPLDEKWPVEERSHYLPGPIQGCTFGGKLWAAPLRTDAGLLYYRTDLVSQPPQTWSELTRIAGQLQTKGAIKYGYVWQGAQYEGLVCDFLEVLYGYGGTVLDPDDPKKVKINSPEAQAALTMMVGWINTISPDKTVMFKEDDSRNLWRQGEAAFMRNWPLVYALSNRPQTSKIVGKFGVHPMLFDGKSTIGHAVIGGWQLGINTFSPPNKVDAAWKFIHYMLGQEAQKALARDAAIAATLKSVYTDHEVLAKNPLFIVLGAVLQTALPRPVTPNYADLSTAIQLRVHQALMKQSKPAAALAVLQSDLQTIVASW
jgi:multiple sugar transport system substrate-binding protein